MAESGYAKEALVGTGWLDEHGSDDDVVVAEVDESPDLYDEGHVPGAVKLHWQVDLQDPVVRDVVDRQTFEALMVSRGIGNNATVVLYGDNNNWYATYAYWYLKIYGHQDARLLDGGRQRWVDEGRELSVDTPSVGATTYAASPRDESIRVSRDSVLAGLGRGSIALVDVRSPQEYSGELAAPPGHEEEGASRTGHIPGARWVPWAEAVRDDGTFKPADELRALYGGRDVTPEKEVRVYCRGGARSAHTWFVLHELLGYENVKNYDGSWAEWGNLVGVPIER